MNLIQRFLIITGLAIAPKAQKEEFYLLDPT